MYSVSGIFSFPPIIHHECPYARDISEEMVLLALYVAECLHRTTAGGFKRNGNIALVLGHEGKLRPTIRGKDGRLGKIRVLPAVPQSISPDHVRAVKLSAICPAMGFDICPNTGRLLRIRAYSAGYSNGKSNTSSRRYCDSIDKQEFDVPPYDDTKRDNAKSVAMQITRTIDSRYIGTMTSLNTVYYRGLGIPVRLALDDRPELRHVRYESPDGMLLMTWRNSTHGMSLYVPRKRPGDAGSLTQNVPHRFARPLRDGETAEERIEAITQWAVRDSVRNLSAKVLQ